MLNKLTHRPRSGWRIIWTVNNEIVGKGTTLEIKDFKTDKDGYLTISVKAIKPHVGSRRRTLTIYTKEGKGVRANYCKPKFNRCLFTADYL